MLRDSIRSGVLQGGSPSLCLPLSRSSARVAPLPFSDQSPSFFHTKDRDLSRPLSGGAVGASHPMASGSSDVYGFPLGDLLPQDAEARRRCAAREVQRQQRWVPFVEKQELPSGPVLKRFCRKGIPHSIRGWAWWHMSGAGQKRQQAPPDYFERMVEQGEQSRAVKQIELDLPRTFPRNPWIAGPHGQEALRKVLTAYAAHNPAVGYCQAMNFVVAMLLLGCDRDPERTFWLMTVLLDQVLVPNTYAPNLDGCHVEMRVLAALIAAKQPKVAAHLESLQCDVSLLATDWFLCLFCTTVPSETAVRLWDCLFLEGPKVLHRLGLAAVQLLAPLILQADNAGELLKAVKDSTSRMHDRDFIMATAFKGIGSLSRRQLDQLRSVEGVAVEAMLRARDAGKRKTDLKKSIAAGQALQEERFEQNLQEATADAEDPQGGPAFGETLTAVQQQARVLAEQVAGNAAAAADAARTQFNKVYTSFGRGGPEGAGPAPGARASGTSR